MARVYPSAKLRFMHDLTERCSVMVLALFNNLYKVFLFTTTFVFFDSLRFGSVVQWFHFLMTVSLFCAFRFVFGQKFSRQRLLYLQWSSLMPRISVSVLSVIRRSRRFAIIFSKAQVIFVPSSSILFSKYVQKNKSGEIIDLSIQKTAKGQ